MLSGSLTRVLLYRVDLWGWSGIMVQGVAAQVPGSFCVLLHLIVRSAFVLLLLSCEGHTLLTLLAELPAVSSKGCFNCSRKVGA